MVIILIKTYISTVILRSVRLLNATKDLGWINN